MRAALAGLPNGVRLTVEPVAGLVILQITDNTKTIPQTVALSAEQCAALIDLLGMVGVLAEDQRLELDLMVALVELDARPCTAPRDLGQNDTTPAALPADVEIPAWLRKVQP